MASTKIYDLCVKTGTYMKDGESRNRYLNIGAVMQREDGGKFLFMDKTFSPAGVPDVDPNRSNIIISMFPIKDGNNPSARKPAPAPVVEAEEPDDDIPF
jgi:hypothetical protein